MLHITRPYSSFYENMTEVAKRHITSLPSLKHLIKKMERKVVLYVQLEKCYSKEKLIQSNKLFVGYAGRNLNLACNLQYVYKAQSFLFVVSQLQSCFR